MIKISEYDYLLPEEKIAKFPLPARESSKLLVYKNSMITDARFSDIFEILPEGSLLIFNNTKVVRARMLFFKETGARIEIFCLEPIAPADYERAFAQKGSCRWSCIVGNLKKWKEGKLKTNFVYEGKPGSLYAELIDGNGTENTVEFSWDCDMTFGQILETLGRMPIPPYLNRETQEIDNTRYQTVYSKFEGSVAAPTAGLHFTREIIDSLPARGIATGEITLHVGAGTFLPVKTEDAARHTMHTEHFEVTLETLKNILSRIDRIVAVGTTSVRTLESLAVLGYRALHSGDASLDIPVSQWEACDIPHDIPGAALICALIDYAESRSISKLKSSTQIMITPERFKFKVINAVITNFHQPKSTLLLLISAITGPAWKEVYSHALKNDYRFLSYGDSSILFL